MKTSTIVRKAFAAGDMVRDAGLKTPEDVQRFDDIVYGEDMAILAGDALLNYADEVATKAFDLADQDEMMNVVEAVKILARKPGIYGMIGGQVADVELEGTPLSMEQILFIHKNKTSALIEACMMIGAVLAGASKEDVMAMEECGEYIGLAFQIQDDILDLTGDEEEIGKPVGSDEKNHKTTYVTLKGLEQSAKDVEEISKKAIEILARYEVGDRYLTNLTRFLIHRTH